MQESISKTYQIFKRIVDILFAITSIILLIPVYLFISILIASTIGFPIIYTQERLGKNFKPFQILKFRTMKRLAEEDGFPQLSSIEDNRVVGFGKILRKFRLDEIPQFFNVLNGDMSIVGPRPERDFYVQQLLKKVPNYEQLFKVRPGITSKGMVEFGYASTLEEMEVRAKSDIEYMKNISFQEDFSILCDSVLVVVNGKGK